MTAEPAWARTVCAIHIHSTYSDGTADVGSIVSLASASGIDALLLTDHHTMAAARHGWAGWRDGVLVIVGYEHADPRDENHLLVFGVDEPLDPTLPAECYVREAVEAGGTVFLAHPLERRVPKGRIRAYPWTAGTDLPFHGIEVWNFMSLWVEGLSRGHALTHYLFPGTTGERPDSLTLALWDRCAESRTVAGIAGLDAHALKARWGPFRVTLFPHARHFQGPLTVVETPVPLSRADGAADTALLLTHLARGHSIMGIARHGSLRGVATRVDGVAAALWGQTLIAANPVEVSVTLPRAAEARLLCSGRVLGIERGKEVTFRISETGVYRMEILRRGAPWMITNHFRVQSA